MNHEPDLRIGLIGLGSVGAVHLEAYQAATGVKVVAASELDEQRLAQFAQSYGFQPYASHRKMLADERLDIACVLTPAAHHLPVALDCLAAGVPTLVEKPITVTEADARAMVGAFEEAGVPLFYGSCYRFLPAVEKARAIISEGGIGDVLLLREEFISGSGPEGQRPCGFAHYPPGLPGGTGMGLVDHGIHLIDIFEWLADSTITSAFGRGNISGEELQTEFAVLWFANGAMGQLVYNDGTWSNALPSQGHFSAGAGWDEKGLTPRGSWQDYPGCIHVHGTRGALRIYPYANALYVFDIQGVRQEPLCDDASPVHFARQIQAFARDIRTSASASTPAEVGRRAIRVLEAIYDSARARKVIDLQ